MPPRTGEPVLPRLLTEAARQQIDDWQVVRQDAASREEVVHALNTLTAALEAGLGGSADLHELSKSQLPRRLLGLLRARMVRLAASEAPPPSGSELLHILLVFE